VRHYLLTGVMLAVFLAACDSPPGEPLGQERPPELGALSVSPARIDFADLTDDQVEDGRINVDVAIQVHVRSGADHIADVQYTIRRPDRQNGGLLASGTLFRSSGSTYEGMIPFSIPAGAVGNYQVVVHARGVGGSLSNESAAMLRYRAAGSAPVIEKVEATPNPFSPPGTLTIVVTVSDPDGLESIAGVFGETPTGQEFELYDDGQTFGDEVAGDGRYTARFDVDSATPGTQTFRFWAIDRMGLMSEVVEYDIVIE
jgi:hypothetical protein